MRLRLLPWRPRWRSRDWDTSDPSGVDLGDEIGLGLLILLVLLFLPLVVGLVLLSVELLALLALLPLLMAGQLLGLLPWVLVVTELDGTKRHLEVRGTRSMLAERRRLRALVV